MLLLLLAAFFSGVCFGGLSFAYQMGRRWHVTASHIGLIASIVGALFMLGMMYWQAGRATPVVNSWRAPIPVWIWAVTGGIGQAVAVLLINPAQRRGPSMPIFCAMNLFFLPVTIYAVLVLHESLTVTQWIGQALAAICVVAGGLAGDKISAGPVSNSGGGSRFVYLLLLATMLLASSLASVGMKQLAAMPGAGTNLLQTHQALFLLIIYLVIIMALACLLFHERFKGFRPMRAILLSGGAAMASLGGFLLLFPAAALPGGISFGMVTTASLITIALIAAGVFHERRTTAWYATIILAVISVILFAIH